MSDDKRGDPATVAVPVVLSPEQAFQLWSDMREPLTAQERMDFIRALRIGVIQGERRRLMAIAQRVKAGGKYAEACDFLMRLAGLPVVDERD